MTPVEKLITEFYDTLLHLRYPGIAQATPKDIQDTILGSENRLFLLSWVLTQNSVVSSEQFSKSNDNTKLVKWYSNMGIQCNIDALLGKVPMRDQVSTLRNLLLFMKKVLILDQSASCENTRVANILQPHIDESINIIPPTCSLTSKLNYNEAMQYLKTRRRCLGSKRNSATLDIPLSIDKAQSETEIFRAEKDDNSATSQEPDQEKVVEKFVEAFESVATWPQLKNDESSPALWKSMNSHIQDLHSNSTILKETLRSTEEISNFTITERLAKCEMPLDAIIEDVVIRLEEVTHTHIKK